MTNAKVPLSKAQLLDVLAVEEGKTSIAEDEKVDGTHMTADCADLLVLKDGNFVLVHSSLGDFLKGLPNERGCDGIEAYCDLQTKASQIMAKACITYLGFGALVMGPKPSRDSFAQIIKSHPFFRICWGLWGDSPQRSA